MSNNDQNNNLFLCASKGLTGKLKAAIDSGADVNAVDKDGYTALMRAAMYGRTSALRMLIDAGASVDVGCETYSEWTALMLALARGKNDCAKILIDSGANVNAKDINGVSVLMAAAGYGNAEGVELLLSSGADSKVSDQWGSRAISWAIINNGVRAVELLLTSDDLNDPEIMITAFKREKRDVIEFLIKSGADLSGAKKLYPRIYEEYLPLVESLVMKSTVARACRDNEGQLGL